MKSIALLLCLACPVFAASPEPPVPVFREATPAESKAFVEKTRDCLVLDVRTPYEYRKGHIDGARLIDFYGDRFDAELKKLDRSKPVLLYCASGGRSATTRDRMKQVGFTHVVHLTDGFNSWKKAGLPVSQSETSSPKATP